MEQKGPRKRDDGGKGKQSVRDKKCLLNNTLPHLCRDFALLLYSFDSGQGSPVSEVEHFEITREYREPKVVSLHSIMQCSG